MAIKVETAKLLPRKRIRASRPTFANEDATNFEPVAKFLKTELDPDFSEPEDPYDSPPSDVELPLEEPRIKLELDGTASFEAKEPIKAEPPYETPLDKFSGSGPKNWKVFIERVRAMRRLKLAPVDEMYHDRIYDAGGPLAPKTVRFQYLIALMLSSQTKDEVTGAAIARLRKALDPDLTPEAVMATPESELSRLIFPVGFYRRKAVYMHKACQILLDEHDGDVPRTIEDITKLPGVGPKMGYLLLQAAWNQIDGIGVDVHVHRLAQLWGWVPATKNPTPEKTRAALEKWLPRELWLEINPLLVGFGQTWCPSRYSPKLCTACHLNDLCPAARLDAVKKKR